MSTTPIVEHSNEQQPQTPRLTYRERRRIEQAELRENNPNHKRRGPTKGLKYSSRNPNEKVTVNFINELRRVVGDKAGEFICDCSLWVKEFFPLDTWTWPKMDKDAQQRLYNKIKAKYNLPEEVGGVHVDEALSEQCASLYKQWRYRLKEVHFRGKSLTEALNSRPSHIDSNQWIWLVCDYWNSDKQKRRSEVNTTNKLNQTETTTNGSKSTARIFNELLSEPPMQSTQDQDEDHEGSSDPVESQEYPLYIRLFKKTKKHRVSGWEPEAEKVYEELKKLHDNEVEKHGKDTLTVKEAYMKVFEPKAGYVRGLGAGARPKKKCRTQGDNIEERMQLSADIQQLKDDAAQREASPFSQIDTLKASNEELKTSNEELVASNDELKAALSRMNIENIKREKKLREDMLKMFEQMRNTHGEARME